jgi:reverse gyrase
LFHQTKKKFNAIDFVKKVIEWRTSISSFFEYITGHKTRAFQEDFFNEILSFKKTNIGIVAGRGIGKTHALAVVALWYILVFAIAENKPIKVIILGGSLKQAKICYGYIMEAIQKDRKSVV